MRRNTIRGMSDREESSFRGRLEQATPALLERIWRLRRGQEQTHCQIRDRSPHGTEALIFANAKLVIARLFPSTASALAWAEAEKAARLRAGYKAR
jgi:hypothetical protein